MASQASNVAERSGGSRYPVRTIAAPSRSCSTASWTARAWARSVGLETPVSAPIKASRTLRSGRPATSFPNASRSVGTPLLGLRNPK